MTIEQQIYSAEDGLATPSTKERYTIAFRLFLQYSQLEPSLLLAEGRDNPRRMEDRIIGYVRYLTNKQKARSTIHGTLCALFHFFEMNDVLLNRRKIKRFMPPDETDHEDRAYTYEEIQRILLQCDERSRMMILLMASTGMRIGALHELKIGHLTEIPEYNVYKITVYASSPKGRYYTFCTPECKKAIDDYLDYRGRFGDPLKDKSPLIREQFNITDRLQSQYPKPVSHRGILWIITNLLRRSGFSTKGEVMRSHGFRKFAITQMIKAKVDYGVREYLVDLRKSRGLDINYDRTTEEDRLQEYLKAVNLLTINPEYRLRNQIRDMTRERQILTANIDTKIHEQIQEALRKYGVSKD